MKIKVFKIFILLLFLIILGRLVNLIFFNSSKYQELLTGKTERYISISDAPRGRILDINHNVLVDNKTVKTITYTKLKTITRSEEIEIAKKISEIITLKNKPTIKELKNYFIVTNNNGDDLITSVEYQNYEARKLNNEDLYNLKLDRITEKMLADVNPTEALIYSLMNKGYSYDTKIIKDKNVNEEEYAKINEANLPGVKGSISWERVYLYGSLMRNILGSVSNREVGIPKDLLDYYHDTDYKATDRVGISGLELQYDNYLKGEKSIYFINNDNTLSLVNNGIKGNDLILNIDINITSEVNKILEEVMLKIKKEKNTKYYDHSYVIISNPNTGGIISVNALKLTGKSFIDITHNIINASYTLGSVIKGASSSVNYLNNLIPINKKIMDSCVKLYLVPKKCSHKSLGYIDDISALAYSSNYYQYLTAIKYVGKEYTFNMELNTTADNFDYYRQVFSSYGLGAKTEIDLPNEQIGVIGSKIAPDLLLNLAIGQYDTYTPIELTQYINTIASGKRMAPMLLNKVVSPDNEVVYISRVKVLNESILDNESLNRIRKGFEAVFSYGTSKNHAKGYKVAGKTGTSESFYDSDFDGKIDSETTTTSVALYVPYDDPKYSVTIISPHISNDESYVSYANKYLTNKIVQFLFENE